MKKNIFKNTVMLYGLSIAKIVFPLLTLPYLTRVLTIEIYGLVAYVKSVMQYMQIFVDFGFLLSGTKSIVAVRNDKESLGEVTGNILFSRILLGVIAGFVLVLLTCFIPLLRDNWFYTLLSYFPVFLSVFLFDYLFRGLEQMNVITIRFIVMKGLASILTFAFVKGDSNILLIPILDILGTFVAILLVLKTVKKLEINVKLGNIRRAVERIFESGIYFISNMATTAFGALNTVLIGAFLPKVDVAYWSVSMQIIGAIQTMYNPIVDGVYPEMVKTKNLKLIKQLLMIVMPLILLGCVISYLLAPIGLKIVGGEQYVSATQLFRFLIPILIFSFPAMVLGWPSLGVVGLELKVTKSTIYTAVFQILGLFFLIVINSFNIIYIAILRSVSEFLLFLIRLYYVKKFVNVE